MHMASGPVITHEIYPLGALARVQGDKYPLVAAVAPSSGDVANVPPPPYDGIWHGC